MNKPTGKLAYAYQTIANLQASVDALRAENERLERERAEQWNLRRDREAERDTNAAVIEELRAEIAALKAVPDGVGDGPDITTKHGYPAYSVAQHSAIVAALRQPVADEREAFEVEIPEIAATYDGLYLTPMTPLKAGEHLMTIAQHLRIEKQLRAALSAPAATDRTETNDQIAAVMLQHGTPEQQAEALQYAGLNPAAGQAEQQPTDKDSLTVRPSAYAVFAGNGNVICFSTQRDHPSLVKLEKEGKAVVALGPVAPTAAGQDVGALVEALERTAAAETAMRTILDFSDSEMRDGDAARDIALDFLNTRGCHE